MKLYQTAEIALTASKLFATIKLGKKVTLNSSKGGAKGFFRWSASGRSLRTNQSTVIRRVFSHCSSALFSRRGWLTAGVRPPKGARSYRNATSSTANPLEGINFAEKLEYSIQNILKHSFKINLQRGKKKAPFPKSGPNNR